MGKESTDESEPLKKRDPAKAPTTIEINGVPIEETAFGKLVERKLEKDNIEQGHDEDRGKWENSLDFLISCLGYAVGLGNIWRFPYLCFKHGGGTFLLPYFIMLLFAGLPVFYLEVTLGQYSGVGPVNIFNRLTPVAGGLGIAVVGVSLFLAFFYNVVVSWSIWYLIATFTGMEWEKCNHWWNTASCWSKKQSLECEDQGLFLINGICQQLEKICSESDLSVDLLDHSCYNGSDKISPYDGINKTSSVEEYFIRYVQGNRGHDWYNFGYPRIESIFCLGLAWSLVAICLVKGIKSSGKIVYFTSLFPYLVLILLAARGFTLPGALDGIKLFLSPDWSRLTDFNVWTDAATQVIFSLGPACGCVITLSSYNSFHRDSHKDSVLIALCNSFTSIFSGLVVFSILGFMAHEAGTQVEEVVQEGPGLAFIVYPEVVSLMPGSQIWAALFFLMLISLALGSIFGAFETVMTALCDHWPNLRTKKPQTVCCTALIMFVLGLPFTCNGGIHMFNLFNSSAPSWNLLLFAFLEVVLVSWVYGIDNFMQNIEEMGIKMNAPVRIYWKICWKYTTPGVLIVLLLLSWVTFGQIGYEGVPYPVWVQILGYMITGSTIIALPLVASFRIKDLFSESNPTVDTLVKPTAQWGPSKEGSVLSLVP